MKRIILIGLVAISATSCTSCRKENQQTFNSHSGDSTITIISPNGGESYHAGDWVLIKWKGTNLPANTVVTAGLDNIAGNSDYGRGMIPKHPAQSDVGGATSNTGEALFQLPVDTCSMYHGISFGVQHTYGKSFKITLVAVFPPPYPGGSIMASNSFRSAHSKDFFTVTAP
jgi:hypothetical protein